MSCPQDKKYDLVLVGATGFTGQLCLEYILSNELKTSSTNEPLRFAICGRSRGKLQLILEHVGGKIQNKTGKMIAQSRLPAIEVADLVLSTPAEDAKGSSDTNTSGAAEGESPENPKLEEVVKSTKCIITAAGPFIRYGQDLVKYCAKHGVDYADVTGETNFFRKMIENYDDIARKTGARIVSHCGMDCIPWDLSAFALAEEAKKRGNVVKKMEFYSEIQSAPSGGTIETVYESFGNKPGRSALPFDPLLKKAETSSDPASLKSTFTTKISLPTKTEFNQKVNAHVGPWVMGQVMGNCVRRSNAILGYNKSSESPLEFCDAQHVKPEDMTLKAKITYGIKKYVFAASIYISPLASLLKATGLVPKPGQGPSEEVMENGNLTVTAFAECCAEGEEEKGTTIELKSRMHFNVDPGYKDTARMLVQAGLSLLDTRENAASKPEMCGVLTPAVALGSVLMDRLVKSGTEFEVKGE